MNNWTDYVMNYQIFIILAIGSGLIILLVSYLFMRKFTYVRSRQLLFYLFYGMDNTELLSVSTYFCRFLLILSFVIMRQELRMTYIAALLLMGIAGHTDDITEKRKLLWIPIELFHIASNCVGLFVCDTLWDYSWQVQWNRIAFISFLLLALFLVLYNLYILIVRISQVGSHSGEKDGVIDEEV